MVEMTQNSSDGGTGEPSLARDDSRQSGRSAAHDLLDWWAGELGELTPVWLKRSFSGPGPVLMHRVDGQWQRRNQKDSSPKPADRRVVAVLEQSDVLIRRCELPLTARAHVDEILRLQISTETPFEPAEVWSDSVIDAESRKGGTLQVRQVLVQKDRARKALDELSALGLEVCGIDALDHDGAPIGSNLLPEDMVKRRSAPVRNLNIALVGALLVCAGAAAIGWRTAQERALAELDAQTNIVAGQAAGALQLNTQIQDAIEAIDALNRRRAAPTEFFNVYEMLATIVPDNSWLTEINYSPPNISLEGGSSASSDLIAALEDAEQIESARFASPVFTDSRTMEDAFSIELKLADGGQP